MEVIAENRRQFRWKCRILVFRGKKEKCFKIFIVSKIMSSTGLGGSVGCAVQPPPRSATFFRGD